MLGKYFLKLITILLAICLANVAFSQISSASKSKTLPKILFIPHDSRPISNKQTAEVVKNAGYEVITPPIEILGHRNEWGNPEALWQWLNNNSSKISAAVLSSDALLYGSLVGSRKHGFNESELNERLKKFEAFKKDNPRLPIFVFGSIMRTPRTAEASGHEEPEYYRRYGADIFRYTALRDKNEVEGLSRREKKEYAFLEKLIPSEAIDDWMGRRAKNYKINEELINLTRQNTFRYFVLGRDDNAPYSQTHLESRYLQTSASDLGKTKFQSMAGIDEIAILMLARAVNELKNEVPFVFVRYNWGTGENTVPAYSDEKIGSSVLAAITASGGMMVRSPERADLVLAINTNPDGKTYEANSRSNDTTPREGTLYFADLVSEYVFRGYPVAIADIAYANGSDNALLAELQNRGLLYKIRAYAGWNTPTNSSGFVIGLGMLTKHMSDDSIDELLTTRYLDDWVYQSNVRNTVARQLTWLRGDGFYGSLGDKREAVTMRSNKMINRFVEENLPPLRYDNLEIIFPWDRMFEADIILKR